MKLKNLLTLMLIAFALPTFSQESRVDWGNPFLASSKLGWGDFLGKQDGKYYNLKWEVDKSKMVGNIAYFPSLEVIGPDMNLDKKIELEWDRKFGWLEGHLLRDNKIYFFGLSYDKDADESLFREVQYDLDGRKLDEKVLSKYGTAKKKMKTFLEVSFSESKDYGVFFHQLNVKKKEPLRFQIALYDIKNEKIDYTDDITIPEYLGDEAFFESMVVDNRGYTYVIVSTTKDLKDKFNVATLFVFSPEGKEVKRQELTMGDEYLRNCSMLATKNDDVYLAAFNMKGKSNKKSRYTGFSIQNIDKESFEITNTRVGSFSEEMLYKMDAKPKKDGTIKHIGAFETKFIRNKDEGEGGYIVAEAIFTTIKSEGGVAMSQVRVNMNFRELIVMEVLPGGDLGQAQVIPKNQYAGAGYVSYFVSSPSGVGSVTTRPGWVPEYIEKICKRYASYFAFTKNNELHVVFNGDRKNADIDTMDDAKLMTNSNKAVTMHYTFNGRNLEKEVIINNKDEDIALVAPRCQFIDGKVIIASQKRSDVQFGVLKD